MAKELVCFSCGKINEIPNDGRVGRNEHCHKCGADLHSCKNCGHHDPKAYNECKEPQAERVQEKDRANYCDHYLARIGGTDTGKAAADLISAADALFKKK